MQNQITTEWLEVVEAEAAGSTNFALEVGDDIGAWRAQRLTKLCAEIRRLWAIEEAAKPFGAYAEKLPGKAPEGSLILHISSTVEEWSAGVTRGQLEALRQALGSQDD